jgi:hypothetical protein
MGREQQPGGRGVGQRLIVSLVVGSLYVAGCASPAIEFVPAPPAPDSRPRDFGMIDIPRVRLEIGAHFGFVALVAGWQLPWTAPWSANVFLLAGWILLLLEKQRAAAALGAAAVLAGFSTWMVEDARLLVGYYLWQASLIAFALGALALWLRDSQGTGQERQPQEGLPPADPG